jgi:hypothetical protein
MNRVGDFDPKPERSHGLVHVTRFSTAIIARSRRQVRHEPVWPGLAARQMQEVKKMEDSAIE